MKNHSANLLPDYVLGLLEPTEAAHVEEHLGTCHSCRAELARLNQSVVALTEALPPRQPPADSWHKIQARLEADKAPAPGKEQPGKPSPRGRQKPANLMNGWAVAACLSLLLAVSGTWWGYQNYQSYQQLLTEQRTVSRWLSRPDVSRVQLQDPDGQPLGSVLTLPDGRALFVLRESAPAGKAYQAWGHVGDSTVSLWVGQDDVFEVTWQGYERLYLSLEPPQGSSSPTQPLASVPL